MPGAHRRGRPVTAHAQAPVYEEVLADLRRAPEPELDRYAMEAWGGLVRDAEASAAAMIEFANRVLIPRGLLRQAVEVTQRWLVAVDAVAQAASLPAALRSVEPPDVITACVPGRKTYRVHETRLDAGPTTYLFGQDGLMRVNP